MQSLIRMENVIILVCNEIRRGEKNRKGFPASAERKLLCISRNIEMYPCREKIFEYFINRRSAFPRESIRFALDFASDVVQGASELSGTKQISVSSLAEKLSKDCPGRKPREDSAAFPGVA